MKSRTKSLCDDNVPTVSICVGNRDFFRLLAEPNADAENRSGFGAEQYVAKKISTQALQSQDALRDEAKRLRR